MDALSALRAVSRNRASRWSYSDEGRDSDPTLAVNRLGNGLYLPEINPKFTVPPSATFFTLGSCFAREIETALLRRGISVSSRLKEIENHADFPLRQGVTTVHDFFNRYNVPSIAREIASLSPSSNYHIGGELIYEQADGQFDDLHYTPAVISASASTIIDRRHWVQQSLREAYRRSDVIVLTLGLSEAWYDKTAHDYLNVVSSPQMLKRYADRLTIQMIGYPVAADALNSALKLILADKKKVILTVSPVPLQVTFLGEDIILANSAAKAILRALCYEACSSSSDVDYFPSFEMVCFSDPRLAWKPDGRHVQMSLVEKITASAIEAYVQ